MRIFCQTKVGFRTMYESAIGYSNVHCVQNHIIKFLLQGQVIGSEMSNAEHKWKQIGSQ
jgi:hypothetical protein